MGHHQLDTLDEQILKLIADNARIPFLEVARACNVSGLYGKLSNSGRLMRFLKATHTKTDEFRYFKRIGIRYRSGKDRL